MLHQLLALRGTSRSKPTARRQSGLVAAAAAVIVVAGSAGRCIDEMLNPLPSSSAHDASRQRSRNPTPSTDSPPPNRPPATALQPPEGYLRSMNTARETAIQRCMAGQGFDYRRSPNLEDIPTDGSDFVEFDEWDAWRTNQLTGTPGFKLALFGVDGDGPDSCTGSANDTVFGAVSAEALATQLQADRYEQARMVARRDDSLTSSAQSRNMRQPSGIPDRPADELSRPLMPPFLRDSSQ